MAPIYGTTTISDRPGQYELGPQSLDRPPTMMQYSPSKTQVPMSTAERTKLVGAMEEMHSNVTVLEEALVNLLQMKELMLGRPTGQQRDALILENMRMQEEINDQLWALNQAAKEISDKLLKDVAIVAAMQQQQQHQQQQQQPQSYQENHPNQPALGLLSSNPPNVPSLHYISAPTVKEPLFNSTEPQRQLLQNVPMQNLGPMHMQMVVGELYGQQQNPLNQVGGSQSSLHSVAQQIEQPVLEYIREKVVPPLVEVKAPLREPGLTMVKSAYDSIERSTSSSSSSSSVKKKSNKRARSHSYDKSKTRRRKGPTSSGRSHNDHSRSSRRSSRSRDRRRSHSRSDRKKSRSRSRSGSRRHSGSRRRSREKYGSKSRGSKNHRIGICGTNNKRYTASLTNRDRRSEEVKRGASQQKIDPVKVALDAKAETDRLAIEKEISTYMKAESYYDAGTEWCKKCNCVLTSVGDLCRHLHSDAHQRQIDPDFDATRSVEVPATSITKAIGPTRGSEFLLPLAAFFCSVCCEFTKDKAQAEEHIKSIEHNNKFKEFLKENPTYEVEFLKERNATIQEAKVMKQKEDDAAEAATKVEKFQIKFTGSLNQHLAKTATLSSSKPNGNSTPTSVVSKPGVVSLGKITLPLGSPTTSTVNIFATSVSSKSTGTASSLTTSTTVMSVSTTGSKLVPSILKSTKYPITGDPLPSAPLYRPRVTGWQLSAVAAQRGPSVTASIARSNPLRANRHPAFVAGTGPAVRQHQTPAFRINAVSASSVKMQSAPAGTAVSGKVVSSTAVGSSSTQTITSAASLKTSAQSPASTSTTAGVDSTTNSSSSVKDDQSDEKLEDMNISDFVVFDEC